MNHERDVKVKVAQSCLLFATPWTSVHGILQARILEWVVFPLSKGLPNPDFHLRSPALQADSLPAEPQGKPKNTGVGSLSLLQGIFPTKGIEPESPALRVDSLPTELSGMPERGYGVFNYSIY